MLPSGYENEMTIEKLKAEMNATDMPLHPMACSGPEAWESWFDVMANDHPTEMKAVIDVMRLGSVGCVRYYSGMSVGDRSAVAYSLEDKVAWAAKGLATKKKGRRR